MGEVLFETKKVGKKYCQPFYMYGFAAYCMPSVVISLLIFLTNP